MGIYAGDQYDLQRTAANPRAWTPRARALQFNVEPKVAEEEFLTLAAWLKALKKITDWLMTIEARLAHAAAADTEKTLKALQYDVLAIIAQLRDLESKTDLRDKAAVKHIRDLSARAATLKSMPTWPASVFR